MPHDLERFLRDYAGPIVVYVWEQDCVASSNMDLHLRVLERLKRLPVVRLPLTLYRDWASTHGIYGTPALVVYHHGQPLFRLFGYTTAATLLQRLHEYGL
jgi:hypothetical protein